MSTLRPGDYKPQATRLDHVILALVPAGQPGVRARDVAECLNYPKGRAGFKQSKGVTTAEETRLILRGFEHLGHVTQRSGWWTRR